MCGDVIESKHRHDFVKCTCGHSFLDGGDDYTRWGGRLIFTDYIDEDTFDDDSFLADDGMEDYIAGYETGKEYERKRILKLLEGLKMEDLIAIIKGEQK
jgi:hypothetical protein